MGKQLMVAGETHEFLEKLNTTKSLWQKNLPTEELLAEMGKKAGLQGMDRRGRRTGHKTKQEIIAA
jgi:hypothetical protein